VSSLFNPLFLLGRKLKYLIPGMKQLRLDINFFDSYCWETIKDIKKKLDENNGDHEKETSIIKLMYENGLDEQTIKDNLVLFFIAGHETTAVALIYAVAHLAQYPDIQQKIRDELNEKIEGELTYDHLKDLVYMDAFIRETLRLHPPVPLVGGRKVDHDITIDNYFIPAETVIQIDLMRILQEPSIWGDPEVFRPERFLDANITKEQRIAWIPFSAGPRFCIGMSFSLEEQKIFLATLVRNFKRIVLAPGGSVVPARSFLNIPDIEKFVVAFE